MEPVIITTHYTNGEVHHIAWSPDQYHHHNINGHPLLNPNYQNFMNRVRNHVVDQDMHVIDHTHTDFHCATLHNNRGPVAYFCVVNDHVVSPVFFTMAAVENYMNQYPMYHTIYVADHMFL